MSLIFILLKLDVFRLVTMQQKLILWKKWKKTAKKQKFKFKLYFNQTILNTTHNRDSLLKDIYG